MKPGFISAPLVALAIVMTLFSGCKKDDPEPELTETERLLTTKKWRYEQTINYGSFDMETDTLLADQDTTVETRANRHMIFQLDGNAFFKDSAADTTTVEYQFSLSEDQTEMRLWESLSAIYPTFYLDGDFRIVALDENQFIIKGDQKRNLERTGLTDYSIFQMEFSSF